MSDPNKPKPLPPDDFSMTTPNIKLPQNNAPSYGNEPANDWEKTNYNYNPKDLQADQWKKPAFTPPQTPQIIQPSSNPPPKVDEWGMTQANINLPFNQPNQYEQPPVREDFSSSRQEDFGHTTPFIHLPQSEKDKYQSSTPPKFKFDEKEEEEEKKDKKGGIPGWVWAVCGLLAMFFFALIVLLGVWFFFINKTGFEVVLKGAPPRSDILIDGSNWGVTSDDGTIRLTGLRAGETKKIEIKNPNFTCEAQDIKGNNGDSIPMIARCTSTGGNTNNNGNNNGNTNVNNPPKECLEIKKGDYAKAAKCAYDALNDIEANEKAGKGFTVEQLLAAMNLYIINFASGDFKINPNDMKFVERASVFIKKLPQTTVIEIGGHTDNKGTDAKNQPLSENRAKSVRDALVLKFGVTPTMLQTKGYGSKMPRESNDTEDGRFRNRRIEYKVLSK